MFGFHDPSSSAYAARSDPGVDYSIGVVSPLSRLLTYRTLDVAESADTKWWLTKAIVQSPFRWLQNPLPRIVTCFG
jgi:hypothetical protein